MLMRGNLHSKKVMTNTMAAQARKLLQPVMPISALFCDSKNATSKPKDRREKIIATPASAAPTAANSSIKPMPTAMAVRATPIQINQLGTRKNITKHSLSLSFFCAAAMGRHAKSV